MASPANTRSLDVGSMLVQRRYHVTGKIYVIIINQFEVSLAIGLICAAFRC